MANQGKTEEVMRYVSSLPDQDTRIAAIRSVNYVLAEQKSDRRVYESHESLRNIDSNNTGGVNSNNNANNNNNHSNNANHHTSRNNSNNNNNNNHHHHHSHNIATNSQDGDPHSADDVVIGDDAPDVNIRNAMSLLQQQSSTLGNSNSESAGASPRRVRRHTTSQQNHNSIDRLTPTSKPGIARSIVSPRRRAQSSALGGTKQRGSMPPQNVTYSRVLFDHKSSRPEVLSLRRGYVVAVYQSVTDEWLKGAFRDRIGLLPSKFVEPLQPLGTVSALLEFHGRHKRHLSFSKGDNIFVVKEGALGWLEGFLPYTGEYGRFPGNYVSRMIPMRSYALAAIVSANSATSNGIHNEHGGSGGGRRRNGAGRRTPRRRARHSEQYGEQYGNGGRRGGVRRRSGDAISPRQMQRSFSDSLEAAATACEKCKVRPSTTTVVYGDSEALLCYTCVDILQRLSQNADEMTELDTTEIDSEVDTTQLPPAPRLPTHSNADLGNDSSDDDDDDDDEEHDRDRDDGHESSDDAFLTRELARAQAADPPKASPHTAGGGVTVRMRELRQLEAELEEKAKAIKRMEEQALQIHRSALNSPAAQAVPPQVLSPPPPPPATLATGDLAAQLLRELEGEPNDSSAVSVQLSLNDFLLPGEADEDDGSMGADALDQEEDDWEGSYEYEEEDDDELQEAGESENVERESVEAQSKAGPTTSSSDAMGARELEQEYTDEQLALIRITSDVEFLFASSDSASLIEFLDDASGDELSMLDSCTLPKLIERLTETAAIDKSVASNLLYTFQAYTFRTPSLSRVQCTPQMLFRLLKMRFFLGSLLEDLSEAASRAGQRSVAAIVRLWVKLSPEDFLIDPALLAEVDQFVHDDIPSTGGAAPAALSEAIELLREVIANPPAPFPQRGSVPSGKVAHIASKSMTIELLAQQLTLLEWQLLRDIRPAELLRQAWSRPSAERHSPNVVRYMAWYNDVRAWAASEVLRGETAVARAVVLRKLIRVAAALFELRNFNGVMELLSALNSAPVFRLKRTWALLKRRDVKHFNALNRAMDPADDYARYRPLLAAARADRVPCVPFLGAMLSDLVELDDQLPDKKPSTDRIVLRKMKRVGDAIAALRKTLATAFVDIASVERVRQRLLRLSGPSDNELSRLSMSREPPARVNTLTRQARTTKTKSRRSSGVGASGASPRSPSLRRPEELALQTASPGSLRPSSQTLTQALAAAWQADSMADESVSAHSRRQSEVAAEAAAASESRVSTEPDENAPHRLAALGVELDQTTLTKLALASDALTRADMSKLVALGGNVRFEKGELVMRSSRVKAQLLRVRKGALRVVSGVGSAHGVQKVSDAYGSSVMPPGMFFGELDLVLGYLHSAAQELHDETVGAPINAPLDDEEDLAAVAAVMGTSVDIVELKYAQELFVREPELACRFYSSLARELAACTERSHPAQPSAMPGHDNAGRPLADDRDDADGGSSGVDAERRRSSVLAYDDDPLERFCQRFELPSEEFVLATFGGELTHRSGQEELGALRFATLYVTPLFLCLDGDLFGVHTMQRVSLADVDEFDVDEDNRGFVLSWTSSVRRAKKKKKKRHRSRVALRIGESEASRCISLLRVVLKHAAEQRSRARKFATRGALLDELLLHHRELAREEANVPRDFASISRVNAIFTASDCAELASRARMLRLRRGELLCEEGRFEQRWYQIVQGSCSLRRAARDSDEQIVVGRVSARETFGEQSLVQAAPSRFSYVADTDDTVVYYLDGAALQSAVEQRPLLAARIFRCVASNLCMRLQRAGSRVLVRFRVDMAREEEPDEQRETPLVSPKSKRPTQPKQSAPAAKHRSLKKKTTKKKRKKKPKEQEQQQ